MLAIDDILWWRKKLKMEKGDIFSQCFSPNPTISSFHMALLGNNCVGHWWQFVVAQETSNGERVYFSPIFSPNPTFSHFHMALLGNNGDWQRRNELRWSSCHRQRKKGKHSFQRPQAKTLQNMWGKSWGLYTCPRWVVWWMSFWLRGSVQPTYSSKSRNV